MMRFTTLLLGVAASLSLAACSTINPPRPGDSAEYRPVAPIAPVPADFNKGAIYQASQSQGLFEDYKARHVGDLVTVELVEKTDAKKSSATSTSKDSGVDFSLGDISVAGRTLAGADLLVGSGDGSRTFDGSGDSSQSNSLTGDITVTVAEVLPNGNLVIQGEKWLSINQGSEYVRLRGIIRPVDISTTNTVQSTQIANAEVSYGGTGTLRDSNAPGWLTRFFNSPLWPI
ncbi:flagellar basal body L-ring protein FlgH [Imhoffiella purpurea]|nr:flagellar basal body L-ring protein FlgH [Imhoffiella purpurea]